MEKKAPTPKEYYTEKINSFSDIDELREYSVKVILNCIDIISDYQHKVLEYRTKEMDQ